MKRPTAGGLARLTIATLLVGYTLRRSHPDEIWQVAAGAAVAPLLAAVALVLVDRALMAWRWFLLLRPIERGRLPPFWTVLRIFFVSTFIGTFLPASIGGDAVRAYSLSRHRVPAGEAVASVFLDRVLGVLSLLLLAVSGFPLLGSLSSNRGLRLALGVTLAGCLVTGALVFSRRAEEWAAALLARLPWRRGRQLADEVVAAMRRYASHRGAVAGVLVVSLGVQVLRVAQAHLIGVSLGVAQPFGVYLALVPLILLVMLLPVTVNGIGTSQAAFVLLFGRFGTPDSEAFALSVLFVALGIVGNLPGALLYTWRRTADTPIAPGRSVTTGPGDR